MVVSALLIGYCPVMLHRWIIQAPSPELVARIATELKCTPTIATLLANRGITTARQAHAFMHPSLQDLRPPDGLKDINKAVKRLYRAITTNEKILIFGDYDVDGVTATAILFEFLRHTGADAHCYIPHRISEGYSLQTHHIENPALTEGVSLILTADCGSSSHAAIRTAREAGIDVIVTDHHEIPRLPDAALATINPKRSDCPSGLEALAGVGVAFYLVVALRRYLRDKGFWKDRQEPNLKSLCDLVALGTVADMVPLKDENRIITCHGLRVIRNGLRPGLSALIKASGLADKYVDTDTLAFYIAPRINAAGRMDHANLALNLMTQPDITAAEPLARLLQDLNRARQNTERVIIDQAQAQIETHKTLLEGHSLVLAQTDWHPGVLGIVASRLARKYHRPVILIAIDGDEGLGSGRSIPGLNLYDALDACKTHLIRFGGHAMAAGLRIQTDQIPAFRDALDQSIQSQSISADLTPVITIDCEIDFNVIDDGLLDAVESLQPFGCESPKPLFMTRNVQVCSSQIVGGSHRRMVLRQVSLPNNLRLDAIQFNIDPDAVLPDSFDRVAYEVQWNRWNGNVKPQLVITAIQL